MEKERNLHPSTYSFHHHKTDIKEIALELCTCMVSFELCTCREIRILDWPSHEFNFSLLHDLLKKEICNCFSEKSLELEV